MKSASHYHRKAWDMIECGQWEAAKAFKRLAAKARAIEKQKTLRARAIKKQKTAKAEAIRAYLALAAAQKGGE